MSKGMIIIGYQGIGKSTIAGWNKCIDLESGNFFVRGHRRDDWYIPYCQIAMDLAEQGYTVFVSGHKVVYEYLIGSSCKVVIICPPRTLNDQWIEKLQIRYDTTGLLKDYKALMNAKESYDDNIVEMCSCGLPVIQINAMDYNLKDYVYRLQQEAKNSEKDI